MKFPRSTAHQDIEDRAAAWLTQRDGGLSASEAREFERWRAADSRHEAAVARLETTWALLRQLSDYRPEARAHPDRDVLAPRRRRLPFPGTAFFAAAAAAAIVATSSLWFWQARSNQPGSDAVAPEVFATTPGGYQRLTLQDGSVVELNSNSEVHVAYAADERRIRLVRGQAYFVVAKNQARPFWVEANAVAVRAVGTAFDVRLGSDDVEVSVTAGTVELNQVAPEDGDGPASALVPLVHAGSRAVIASSGDISPAIEQLSAEAMRAITGWHGPRLTFIDTPLAEVVEQFNRQNDVQLSLGDAELATMAVGGSFSADNVETFVRLLSSNGDIVVERPETGRIVLRKAR